MDTVKETVSKFQIWMFMCAPGFKRGNITAYLSGHWETNKITVILLDFFSINQNLITSQMAEWQME